MRRASGASIIALFALTFSALSACGERFTGIDDPSDEGGSDAGGTDASAGESPGTAGRGGKPGAAGSGGAAGAPGTGGTIDLGGLPSIGGIGGTLALPPVPEEGLELWLRADHGVVEVGELVATWKDSSPKQRNATQTATNYRPKLVKDAMSGRSGVVFDGTDDYLRLPAFDASFEDGVSILAIALQEQGPTCDAIFEASNGSEIEDVHLGYLTGLPIYEVGSQFVHDKMATQVYETPVLLAGIHSKSQVVQVRRNSVGLGEGMFPLPPNTTRTEAFIGRSLYPGCSTWDGGIAEVLVYSRAVSAEELVQIETYLQSKWGCCTE